LVSNGVVPFSKLRNAAKILESYATQLDESDVFERLERTSIIELLGQFWQVMEPFAEVQILEKNPETS